MEATTKDRVRGSSPSQVPRRSTRCGRGEKRRDSEFFWYNPQKVKALSRQAMRDSAVSHSATDTVQSSGERPSVSKRKPQASRTSKSAENQSSGLAASLGSKAERGTKRRHEDTEDNDDEETRKQKVQCTGFPKVIIRIRKPAGAAQGSASCLGSGPGTAGNENTNHRRRVSSEADTKDTEDEKADTYSLESMPNEKENRETPDDHHKDRKPVTANEIDGRMQKRRRHDEENEEQGPQRKLRSHQRSRMDDSYPTTATKSGTSATNAPFKALGKSATGNQREGDPPSHRLRPRIRAGLKRGADTVPKRKVVKD